MRIRFFKEHFTSGNYTAEFSIKIIFDIKLVDELLKFSFFPLWTEQKTNCTETSDEKW